MGRRVARMRNCEKYIQNIGLKTLGIDHIAVLGATGMMKSKADVKCDLKVRSALSKVTGRA